MKYGLTFPNYGEYGNPQLLADLAHEAEESGWDGFFVWDHLLCSHSPEPTSDPWILLTAIALRTSRIRIGVLVTPLSRRRPWKVARETVTLDHLSGGRLIFGAGLGAHAEEEFTAFGDEDDLKIRAGMLDEGLQILNGFWSGKPFSFLGKHYKIKETLFLPSTLQQPRIPVWIAGVHPNIAPMRRAARWDGFFATTRQSDGFSPADVRKIAATIQPMRTSTHPFDIIISGHTRLESWSADINKVQALEKAGATWWLDSFDLNRGNASDARKRIHHGPPFNR